MICLSDRHWDRRCGRSAQEYQAIIEMYEKGEISVPIKAFFGDLLDRPRGGREMPIALLNQQVNLDQLLAIHHGMKYPSLMSRGRREPGKPIQSFIPL